MAKRTKGTDMLECGCKHDTTQWLVMCDTHRSECNGVHRRWNEERIAKAIAVDYASPQAEETK